MAQSRIAHYFAPPVSVPGMRLSLGSADAVDVDVGMDMDMDLGVDGSMNSSTSADDMSVTGTIPGSEIPSTTTIGAFADVAAVLTLLVMLSRTYMYVARRRKGQVGPGSAPTLLRFACVQGLVQSVYIVLRMYLTPLHGGWIASLCRMVFLVLSVKSDIVYTRIVKRVYETYRQDLDGIIDRTLSKLDELNRAMQAFAIDVLQIIAVGGVGALFPTLRDAVTEAQAQEGRRKKQGAREEVDRDMDMDMDMDMKQLENSQQQQQRRLVSVDQQPYELSSQPRAHFQQPEERVNAIATALAGHNLNGAIQRSIVQAPKPRFEDAYQMRLEFRRRAAMRAAGKKKGDR